MTEPPDHPPEVVPGQVVGGKWRIVAPIGRGGMGAVYEGQNISIGKKVALKFIDAEFARQPDVANRFQREAEAASLVESAHIVHIFDSGTTDTGIPYIVMELLRGEDLRARLRRMVRLPKEEAVHIVAQTLPKNICVEKQVAENLWPILGNPLQLHQALLNLCINAGEAMPEGGQLALIGQNFTTDAQFVAMHSGADAEPHVLLEISDTGGGIPPELRERIFEPFFTTKELGRKNVGMGLSTALSIVKSHHGLILVKSDVGKGSVFQIYLPAEPDAAAEKHAV